MAQALSAAHGDHRHEFRERAVPQQTGRQEPGADHATRSGYEQNYARFGKYLSEAITDPAADLDKDGQVSVLEAFLTAARRVTSFYATEGRLASEHALLEDNGDGLGTPAGIIEGFVTPRGLPTWARIGIGLVAEAAFLAWVFVWGRRAHLAGATGDLEEWVRESRRRPDSDRVA